MTLSDAKIERMKGIAAESAEQQAKSAEGPTLPQSLHEIPDDWLEAERDYVEQALGEPIQFSEFLLYVSYLTYAYKEENARMLEEGRRMS